MSRITTLALAGLAAAGIAVGSVSAAQAAPLPALTGSRVAGAGATVDQVGWRRGYGYRRGGIGVGGALAAGAAIGLLGGAAIAASGPRYGYGYPAYGYGYPAYGYARPAYGYPAYGYGYPAYGW